MIHGPYNVKIMRSFNDYVQLKACNDIDLRGCVMTQAVSGRSLTVKSRVQSQGSPYLALWLGFPLALSSHQCSTLIHSPPTDPAGIAMSCTDSLIT